MSAYDKCYLDEMLQKHRYLFKLIGRNRTDAFKVIADYMNSDYRKNMDQGNPLFLNKTPKQILQNMNISMRRSVKRLMSLFWNGWQIFIPICSGSIMFHPVSW